MILSGGELKVQSGADLTTYNSKIDEDLDSTATATITGNGSSWTINRYFNVGVDGTGTLNVEDGATVTSTARHSYIGLNASSDGTVNVSDAGSTWYTDGLFVGHHGTGKLNITEGAYVINSSYISYIGLYSDSNGEVNVNGTGSTWEADDLYVGGEGTGTLNITNGGLVSVAGTLTIDADDDADSFINMETGGMLALYGDEDDSLSDFLNNLVSRTDAINWWDDSLNGGSGDWALLSTATLDTDYWISYIDDVNDDLDGYTVLTVGTYASRSFTMLAPVPEPSTMVLILNTLLTLGFVAIRKRGDK